MSILVQSQPNFSTGFTPTKTAAFGSPNTAGNSIVLIICISGTLGANLSTLFDSQGNSYSQVLAFGSSGGPQVLIYRADSIKAGSNTVTVELTGTETWGFTAFETLPLGAVDKTSTGSGTSNAPSAGTVNTTHAGEFCTAGFSEPGTTIAPAAGSGWTLDGGNNFGAASEHQVQASAGPLTGDFTTGGTSVTWAAAMATFPAAGGGSTKRPTVVIVG